MKTPTLWMLGLVVLILPISASAAVLQAGEQISVSHPLTEDAYLAGSLVTVSQPTEGDLFTAGASVTISGDVSEDLFAAGSSVIINSAVGDDLRVAGSNVILSGSVGDDLFVAGSVVQISSQVTGDLRAAGAAVIIDGTVNGTAHIAASSLTLNGTITGDVTAYVEELTLGETTQITGTLTYYAEQDLELTSSSIGTIVYAGPTPSDKIKEEGRSGLNALLGLGALMKLLGLLTSALIIGLIWHRKSQHTVEQFQLHFWKNVLTGLVAMIVVPVVTILLFASLIGWPIAALLIGVCSILCLLSFIFTPITLGSLVIMWIKKHKTPQLAWYSIVLGVILVTLLTLIPVLGWIGVCLIFLGLFGTFIQSILHILQSWKA